MAFHEVKCNLIERTKLIGVTAAKNCCQWFCYICTCSGFLVLWVVEFIYRCGRKKVHFVWSIWQFFPSLLCFLLSNSVMHACLIWGMAGANAWCVGCSWLGCQVLPAITAVFILVLAANSGSSRMSQAPNLHLEMQLFKRPMKQSTQNKELDLSFYLFLFHKATLLHTKPINKNNHEI